jgi:hypothetical protein
MAASIPVKTKGSLNQVRWMAPLIAVAIIVSGGVLYGNYMQRFNRPVELAHAAAQLEQFPREFGRWKAIEGFPIDATALQILECAGYVNRRYLNQDTGRSIQLAIIVGPPGPIAVHAPEICYSSRSYEIRNERKEIPIEAATGRHTFWRVDFTTRDASIDGLRVYYAWTSSGVWNASGSPRFEFAGEPLLFKIQLATYVAPYLSDEDRDAGRHFLEDLLQFASAHLSFDGSADHEGDPQSIGQQFAGQLCSSQGHMFAATRQRAHHRSAY